MILTLEVELPEDLARFRLPGAVAARLHQLLERQDSGQPLTAQDREEAEGLVNLSEFLTLLRIRGERVTPMMPGNLPNAAERHLLAAGRLSAWSMAAFGCLGLAIVANAVWWRFFPPPPTDFGLLSEVAISFLGTLLLTLVGTVCGWLGVRQRAGARRLAMTALILNGATFAVCLFGGLMLLFG